MAAPDRARAGALDLPGPAAGCGEGAGVVGGWEVRRAQGKVSHTSRSQPIPLPRMTNVVRKRMVPRPQAKESDAQQQP